MFKKTALILIKAYRALISPLLGNNCRFYPSCSHYSYQSIEKHGLIRGSLFTLKRILKCHPWNPGGVDLP